MSPHELDVSLDPAAHREPVQLAQFVELKRVELENAQLRQELAVRRVVEQMGLSGRNVKIELDKGRVVAGPLKLKDAGGDE